MLPFLGAIISGLGATAGAAASVVSGLAGAAVSAVGGLAGATVSGLGGLVSGAGSLLFGAPAAGMTEGQLLAAQAVPSYYETAGGVLGALPAAASTTVDYLGNLIPSAMGVYQAIKPPEKAVIPPAVRAVPAVQAPAPAPAPTVTKAPLPIYSQQPPQVMTVGAAAKPKETNYMLLIALAALAFFLLRKK